MSVTQESKVKVIAITGASSGIGEATARALGAGHLGWAASPASWTS